VDVLKETLLSIGFFALFFIGVPWLITSLVAVVKAIIKDNDIFD
jgi:hypothetical protein